MCVQRSLCCQPALGMVAACRGIGPHLATLHITHPCSNGGKHSLPAASLAGCLVFHFYAVVLY